MANHISAIHVLKSKLRLQDDDYRVLLKGLTTKTSSKDMTDGERQKVRDHLQGLAERAGLVKPTQRRPMPAARFAKAKADATRNKRIESAIQPRSAGGHSLGATDDDDFLAGFNSR